MQYQIKKLTSLVYFSFLGFIILISISNTNGDLVWADTLVGSIEAGKNLSIEYDPVNREVSVLSRDSDTLNNAKAPWWGCMGEITKHCSDMTNASSTWIGIIVGGAIGAFITWLVYFLQKKTAIKQDQSIEKIQKLDENHDNILKLMQQFQVRQEKLLEQILSLNMKIDSSIDKNKEVR